MGGTELLIAHSAVCESHEERLLTSASVFTLGKSILLYILMCLKSTKKGAGRLEEFCRYDISFEGYGMMFGW